MALVRKREGAGWARNPVKDKWLWVPIEKSVLGRGTYCAC